METEVRYLYMKPAEIVKRRRDCPVVYIPIGTLEWHGLHAPYGLDSIQAEELACRCARQGGGLVFPTLHYGENRLAAIMDANTWAREEISEIMEYDSENATPERWLFDEMHQDQVYHDLLIHILNQAESFGFKVAIFVCGHYPLVDRATAAVLQYNKQRRKVGNMLAWATVDYIHLEDQYDCAGDHAAGWETSHILACKPELIAMDRLPERGEKTVGVFGVMPPQDATAEFGNKTLDEAAEAIVKEAMNRLKNPMRYKDHGSSIRLGISPEGPDHIGGGKK